MTQPSLSFTRQVREQWAHELVGKVTGAHPCPNMECFTFDVFRVNKATLTHPHEQKLAESLERCLHARLPGMLLPGVHEKMLVPSIKCMIPKTSHSLHMSQEGDVEWLAYYSSAKVNGTRAPSEESLQLLDYDVPCSSFVGLNDVAR